MFMLLKNINIPSFENEIIFTIKMTHDKKFSEYNNYFRKYCDLDYFDEEKLKTFSF